MPSQPYLHQSVPSDAMSVYLGTGLFRDFFHGSPPSREVAMGVCAGKIHVFAVACILCISPLSARGETPLAEQIDKWVSEEWQVAAVSPAPVLSDGLYLRREMLDWRAEFLPWQSFATTQMILRQTKKSDSFKR